MTEECFKVHYETCKKRFEDLKQRYPSRYDDMFKELGMSHIFAILTFSTDDNELVWTSSQIQRLVDLLEEYRKMNMSHEN